LKGITCSSAHALHCGELPAASLPRLQYEEAKVQRGYRKGDHRKQHRMFLATVERTKQLMSRKRFVFNELK
jgi:hypothetical protein